jgi:hypothetical protein
MNNTRITIPAAKIISYAIIAAEDTYLEIKVIGLIVGKLMRGTAPRNYLSHKDIRDLQLTRLHGDHSNHPLVKAFLSLPAANSALVQGSLPPPATPTYNFRVDIRDPCDVQKKTGRPRSQAQRAAKPAVPTAEVLVGSATQPCGAGQAPAGAGSAGQPPRPPPSAPAAPPAGQADAPAASCVREDSTNDSGQPPENVGQARQQQSSGMPATMPAPATIEQIGTQTVGVIGPGDKISQIGEQELPDAAPFVRNINQRLSQAAFNPGGRWRVSPAGGPPPWPAPPPPAQPSAHEGGASGPAGGPPLWPAPALQAPPSAHDSAAGGELSGKGGPAGGPLLSPAPSSSWASPAAGGQAGQGGRAGGRAGRAVPRGPAAVLRPTFELGLARLCSTARSDSAGKRPPRRRRRPRAPAPPVGTGGRGPRTLPAGAGGSGTRTAARY